MVELIQPLCFGFGVLCAMVFSYCFDFLMSVWILDIGGYWMLANDTRDSRVMSHVRNISPQPFFEISSLGSWVRDI